MQIRHKMEADLNMNNTTDETTVAFNNTMPFEQAPEPDIADVDHSPPSDFLESDGSDVESLDEFEDALESHHTQSQFQQYREVETSSSEDGVSISDPDSDNHLPLDHQDDAVASDEVSEVVSRFNNMVLPESDNDFSSDSHDNDPIIHSHDVSVASNDDIASQQTTTPTHRVRMDSPNPTAIDQDMHQFISHFLTHAPDSTTLGEYRRLTQFAHLAAQWAFENATTFISGWQHLGEEARRASDESFHQTQALLGPIFNAPALSNQSSGDSIEIDTSGWQATDDLIMSDVDDDN